MGCSASKSTGNDITPNRHGGGADIMRQRENSTEQKKKRSIDSGISLTGEYPSKSPSNDGIFRHASCNEDQSCRKGIAFEIALGDNVVTRSPPKRLTSRLESRNRRLAEENEISTAGADAMTMHALAEKQIRAEQLREMERHSMVARQRKREARARQVQERRQKLHEDLEMSQDEEFSDIEVDANFHDADDYDFTSDVDADVIIPHKDHQSSPDGYDTITNNSNDEGCDNF